MKKLFLFLALISITLISVNAQPKEDVTITKASSEINDVIDHVYDKTTEAIQSLAQALKVPAEHVYEVLVKQQVINSIANLTAMIIGILIGILMAWFAYKDWLNANAKYRKNNPREDIYYNRYDLDDGGWIFFILIGIVITAIVALVLLFSVGNILTGIVNPEYGAIKDILGAIGS